VFFFGGRWVMFSVVPCLSLALQIFFDSEYAL
jgi:hypothetical protein